MDEGIDLVEFAVKHSLGGEVIVPIAPSYTVGDVAEAVCDACEKKVIGPRQAEKMHEVLISEFEMPFAIKKDGYYIITPEKGRLTQEEYLESLNAEKVEGIMEYSSGNNSQWLSVQDIEEQIAQL
jgi:UDP-N-acetylglucosamine 4,6-dehydratase